jgi:hypothetical protein
MYTALWVELLLKVCAERLRKTCYDESLAVECTEQAFSTQQQQQQKSWEDEDCY